MRGFGFLVLWLGLGLSGLFSAAVAGVAPADAAAVRERLVVLVRHAEKRLDQGADPGLNALGEARARALAAALADADVAAIVVTEFKRTQATAAPLATARGLEPTVVATQAGGSADHAQAVAAAVRAAPADVVLVVGHSNTVPAIIAALGGPEVAPIGDDDYGNLYLLWLGPERVRLVQTRY
ncbi:MAG: histidine phosphatase family protein [Lysobacterales bacterium]